MKKIIFLILFCFSFIASFAQSYNKNLSSYAYLIKRGTFDSTLILPYHDTTINSSLYRSGVIIFNNQHQLCIWNGSYWNVFKPFNGGDTTNISMYWDSTEVKNYVAVYANSQGFLKMETDPVFTTSPAYGITAQDTLNWDSAYVRVNWDSTNNYFVLHTIDGRADSIHLNFQSVVDTVNTISQLESYLGFAHVLIVTDTLRGGTFHKSDENISVDSGIVFNSEDGDRWVRQFDHSKGVNVDWWGSRDSYSILKAVAAAGENAIINFTPGKTYRQYDAIIPQNGQIFHGNRATLFRAPMTITTLKADANPDDSFFVVNNMPPDWKIGDYLFPFDDSSEVPYLIYYARKIVDINEDTAFVDHPMNFDRPTQTTIPAGTFIWKVFHQFTSIVPDTLGSNWVYPLHYQIDNLIFDGNKDSTSAIPSWYINNAIFNMGFQVKLFQDEFYNLPSDCINGHGYEITNCIAKNINASFVHVSKNASIMGPDEGIIATGNYTDSTNLEWEKNGHGTAVIELSNSAGYFIFSNNRFYNGSNNCIGLFTGSQGPKGYRSYGSHEVIISNNYFKNFPYIYNGAWLDPDDDTTGNITGIYIYGNVFDSCGQNDYTSRQTALNDWTQGVRVGDNLLLHGTTLQFPVINSDSSTRYVLNNATTTPQIANINISGTVKLPSIKSALNDTSALGINDIGEVVKIPRSSSSGTDTATIANFPLTKSISGNQQILGVDTLSDEGLVTNNSLKNKYLIDTTQPGEGLFNVTSTSGLLDITGGANSVINQNVDVNPDTTIGKLATQYFVNSQGFLKSYTNTNLSNTELTQPSGITRHYDINGGGIVWKQPATGDSVYFTPTGNLINSGQTYTDGLINTTGNALISYGFANLVGGVAYKINDTVTTNYTIVSTDVILITHQTSAITITLPTTGTQGRLLIIRNAGTGDITLTSLNSGDATTITAGAAGKYIFGTTSVWYKID